MHKAIYRFALAVGAALMATGCANSATAVSGKEDILESAGFVPKMANSEARMASLKSLPPNQFMARTINGRPSYLYADPVVCGCVYIGDQKTYEQYRQKMAARQTATDQQIRAILSTAPLPGEEGLL